MRPFLRSRLRPPRVAAEDLKRPRLFDRLDEGLRGLSQFTLVCAPAGYGKTTLLAQWVQLRGLPVAWLSLDESDNDVEEFLQILLAALETMAPDRFGSLRRSLDTQRPPAVEQFLPQLGNELEDLDEFILVLDDFDAVKDPGIMTTVRNLVLQPPGPLHLFLCCRADPALPLGALRGRGRLNEVRAADLRFSTEEASAYLNRTFGRQLSDTQVTSLVDRTEGWVVGIRLAALSLSGRDNVDKGIEDFAGSDRYVADYLMDELFAPLDPRLQRYLMATSILDRLSAPLCAAVIGDPLGDLEEGRTALKWLAESNLFVVSLDDQGEWFRYHRLFRELLHHRLRAEWPAEKVEELHGRAGEWLAANGDIDAALDHLAAAHRPDWAAGTVESQREAAIDQERWSSLERWLGKLAAEEVASRPCLVLTHAWLARQSNDWDGVRAYCRQALELLDLQRPPYPEDGAIRGEIAALRAQADCWHGRGEQGLQQARRALALLPPTSHYARTVATGCEGVALQMLGRDEEASLVFRRASLQEGEARSHPRLLLTLALTGLLSGQLEQPRKVAAQLLAEASALGLEESVAWGHFLAGFAAYLGNDLSTAEAHFRAVPPHHRSLIPAKQCAYGLAWIRQSQGLVEEALAILDRFGSAVTDPNVLLGPEVRLLRARLAAASGLAHDEAAPGLFLLESSQDGDPGLALCYEYRPITALAFLATHGDANDMPGCEAKVERLLESARASRNIFRSVQCLILQALILDRQGLSTQALDSLRQAIALAAPGRSVRLFTEMGERVHSLLQALRLREPGDGFVAELLSSFTFKPPVARSPAAYLHSRPRPDPSLEILLTNRETDVLELLSARLSNKEIARQLVISPATVKRHTLSIYGKLAVGGRREAVAKARLLGLLPTAV